LLPNQRKKKNILPPEKEYLVFLFGCQSNSSMTCLWLIAYSPTKCLLLLIPDGYPPKVQMSAGGKFCFLPSRHGCRTSMPYACILLWIVAACIQGLTHADTCEGYEPMTFFLSLFDFY